MVVIPTLPPPGLKKKLIFLLREKIFFVSDESTKNVLGLNFWFEVQRP